ncbi:MAG TPA: uroporphyrinogen-III synthase [Ectothiorhodospiraceae bacterium]|nr:uroporphyrinogen-III synthase [Ectothiorhodospiraceae bacterium]
MRCMPTPEPHSGNLKGLRVLVTRPAEQATPLCRAIEEVGGIAIHYPTIEIEPIAVAGTFDPATADIGIFISRNAVRYALKEFPQLANSAIETITVGQGSADEYHKITGRQIDFIPHQHFNSEGVLALPELSHVAGKSIVLFKGEGGRDKLESELKRRKAKVIPLELYRRIVPANPPTVEWQNIDIIITTSNMALENLHKMISEKEHPALLNKPLVVISRRGEQLAHELGFVAPPLVADSADTATLIELLNRWLRRQPKNKNVS